MRGGGSARAARLPDTDVDGAVFILQYLRPVLRGKAMVVVADSEDEGWKALLSCLGRSGSVVGGIDRAAHRGLNSSLLIGIRFEVRTLNIECLERANVGC